MSAQNEEYLQHLSNLLDIEDTREAALILLSIEDFGDHADPWIAYRVAVLCGKLRVLMPTWASDTLERVVNDRTSGRIKSLDEAFGFAASRGKTPAARKDLLDQRNEELMFLIWRLTLLEYSAEAASEMVACRILKTPGWNRTIFDLDFRSRDPAVISNTLLKMYWLFKRDVVERIEEDLRSRIEAKIRNEKEEILKYYK